MERRHLSRLREEQDKAIQATEEQLSTWKRFKTDYTTVQEKLRTLPDKVSHPYKVPIGSKAFMPGINKQIADLEKQRELLKPRVDITSQLQDISEAKDGMVEIQEEYDAEKEQKWKEQHRRNLQRQRKKDKEEREKLAGSQHKKPLSDDELWARLDQLERIETEMKELSRIPMTDNRIDKKPSPIRERIVRWADERDGGSEQISSSGEEEVEDELGGVERPKVIRFTHTQGADQLCRTGGDNSSNPVVSDPPQITSPADIYKLFQPTHPKSILKSKGGAGMESTTEQSGVEKNTFLAHPTEAFSGTIVERDLGKIVPMVTEPSVSDTTPAPVGNPPKRVSKFKAGRQKQQNSNR
ncbi:unconventional prefoldin RPB5 interactor-like isoform X2 [Liolophura sinensis]|uniref:unconventional prefoldin RPB5 interactor-like isoform X2 n=1 Tax=Liolophura sinensis TaxID=3198878 RepID=UPI003159633D